MKYIYIMHLLSATYKMLHNVLARLIYLFATTCRPDSGARPYSNQRQVYKLILKGNLVQSVIKLLCILIEVPMIFLVSSEQPGQFSAIRNCGLLKNPILIHLPVSFDAT
jgi:hypothetical protein